jgi:CRISPR/Cas system-associated exonuclease Cas4 (RecB family)
MSDKMWIEEVVLIGDILLALQESRGRREFSRYLQGNLPVTEKILPIKPGDFVRASSIPFICPREEVLCSRFDVTRVIKKTADQRWWTDMGSAMHYLYQELWLKELGVLSRVEEVVESSEYGVRGHVDGVLALPGTLPVVVDFKNVNSFGFHKWSETPDPKNVIQLETYMWLIGIDRGLLVYVNKQGSRLKDSISEYWIQANEQRRDKIKRVLISIKEGVRGGVLPDGVCCTRDERRAKRCAVKEVCFREGNGP